MGLFSADHIVINPPAPAPAQPAPAPAQPCSCPPPAAAQPPPAPQPPAPYPPAPGGYYPAPAYPPPGYYPPGYPPPAYPPPAYPPPGAGQPPQPPVVVVQPPPSQGDRGAWTQNGLHYMSATLASSYYTGKLMTAVGQAHLLVGASDQQLLDDYRNGDVSAPVLALFQLSVPKGMFQTKQSPVMISPDFPPFKSVAQQNPIVLAGGSWTFNVPAGWSYTVTTSAPIQRQPLPVPAGGAKVPANITFTVDALRTTQSPRPDGSMDVTVAGDWAEVFPTGVEDNFIPIPVATYSATIIATLYPSDNPPPST